MKFTGFQVRKFWQQCWTSSSASTGAGTGRWWVKVSCLARDCSLQSGFRRHGLISESSRLILFLALDCRIYGYPVPGLNMPGCAESLSPFEAPCAYYHCFHRQLPGPQLVCPLLATIRHCLLHKSRCTRALRLFCLYLNKLQHATMKKLPMEFPSGLWPGQCHLLLLIQDALVHHIGQESESGFEECARTLLTDDRAGKVNPAVSTYFVSCKLARAEPSGLY